MVMMNTKVLWLSLFLLLFAAGCNSQPPVSSTASTNATMPSPRTGASQTELYLPQLQQKRIAVVANQTSDIGTRHLVDSLLALKVNVVKVFAPEHGFRGDVGAGEHVDDSRDAKTGLPLISLYGKNKKPSAEMLRDVDVVLFDIQDVGARFYTYLSTMHYVMEAAAESKKEVIVLDRPNPNGHLVYGPILEEQLHSFVGMHPIPTVHGCTLGEMARMINGEGWLAGKQACSLTVIPCAHYTHQTPWHITVPPSPNLKNDHAIALYPFLCLFEGTNVSVGRGTDFPFEVMGMPGVSSSTFCFTPRSIAGVVTNPMHEGKICCGQDLRDRRAVPGLDVELVQWMYQQCPNKSTFFSSPLFFDKLVGTSELRECIQQGGNPAALLEKWNQRLAPYLAIRAKYLLYP